jgi:hypothetical protein
MSVLLVAPPAEIGDAVVTRLLAAGDEVRVVARSSEEVERWGEWGAHTALGDPEDPDLIERAAQDARSVVTFDDGFGGHQILEAAIEGGSSAGVERIIICSPAPGAHERERVSRSSLEHVVLVTGSLRRRRLSFRARALTPGQVAVAVDAADDLAGHPRVVLDLRENEAWRALDLEPPAG